MIVRNHNGAPFGEIECIDGGYIKFYPKKEWDYSAHELEEIAKKMRAMEKVI
jgi:hypothetical protein